MTPLLNDDARHDARRALQGRALERTRLRALRRGLPAAERAAAERAVLRHLLRRRWLRPGSYVAAYLGFDGELDPRGLIEAARRRGCRVYLPRITHWRRACMRFVPADGAQARNRYGIREPVAGEARAPGRFQLIFLPLVGFDARGVRLGMGAGYYDRALAFRRLRRAWKGPRLIGLGFAFQEIPPTIEFAHDIRLDAVITERGVTLFKGE